MSGPVRGETDTVAPALAGATAARERLAGSLFDEILVQPTTVPEHADADARPDSAAQDWLQDSGAERRAAAKASNQALLARIGEHLGPYRLVALLGRGGMGAVYAAERDDGEFVQRVALKLIRPGANAEHLAVRFRRERTILARLEHAHIARLLDGGLSPVGEPWFALELIEGQALQVHCAARELSLAARLGLFLQVCDAVAYAHRNLIVHRDLKPSNILVTADGDAKLLDFGIAKLLDESADNGAETQADERVLTPDYAAPEQVLGRPVTTATDVYALGLVLFELLTGQQAQKLAGKSLLEAERTVVEHELPRPSTARLDPAADAVSAPPPRALRGDLDAIVMKALRKEPERRYSSAQEFAEDIRRHLDGRPVLAVGDASSYRLGKFVRRHRIAIGAAVAVLLAVILGFGAALWQAREARLQADLARHQADNARQVTDFVLGLFRGIDPEIARGREITARELLDTGAKSLGTQLASQPDVQADLLDTLGEMYIKLTRGPEAVALLERSLVLRRQGARPADPATAATLIQLASARLLENRYTDARELLLEGEQLLESAGPEYDDQRVRSKRSLVLIHNRTGDFAAAERAARQLVALQERRFGSKSREYANALGFVGWALSWQSRYAEARSVLKEALSIERAAGAAIGPDTLTTLYSLTNVEEYLGNYPVALDMAQRNETITRELYGADHWGNIAARAAIAKLKAMVGDVKSSEAEFRALLVFLDPARRHVSSTDRMFHYGGLAETLVARGKLEEARALYVEVIEKFRLWFGRDAKLTMLVARKLGSLLVAQGKVDEGERVLSEALTTFRALEGTSSSLYADVEWRMALVQIARGAAADAEPAAHHALAVSTEKLGPRHDQTAAAANALGRALFAQGKTEAAIPHLRHAVETLTTLFGVDDLRTAVMRFDLGLALLAAQEKDAKQLLRAAARTIVTAPGNELAVRDAAAAWLAKNP